MILSVNWKWIINYSEERGREFFFLFLFLSLDLKIKFSGSRKISDVRTGNTKKDIDYLRSRSAYYFTDVSFLSNSNTHLLSR